MKQKFKMLTRVHVCKVMPKYMSHFPRDFDAIVKGTYSQLCGGKDIDNYCIYQLSKSGKKIINEISWYKEDQLAELEYQDREEAEKMIEKFNFKN